MPIEDRYRCRGGAPGAVVVAAINISESRCLIMMSNIEL